MSSLGKELRLAINAYAELLASPRCAQTLQLSNARKRVEGLLKAFEESSVLVERDACAQVCEAMRYTDYVPPEDGDAAGYYKQAAEDCAEAIRSRSQPVSAPAAGGGEV